MNKIFVVNPGSTSTKVALFEEEKKVFSCTVEYDAQELEKYDTISEQLPYRLENIRQMLRENKLDLTGLTACVGRCGSVLPVEGGTYEISELMLEHSRTAVNGVHHPAQLGGQIASVFAKEYGCPVYTVNPPEVDEFMEVTRVTGIKEIRRESHLHALNLKETAIQHCRRHGQKYEEGNYIICHLGGGISVSAHKRGRMIDGNDIAKGMGPIAPTRCGTIPAGYLIEYIFRTQKEEGFYQKLCTRSGGIVDLLGTSDMREVFERVNAEEEEASLVWNAMIYSICKEIGAMSVVLSGEIDGILLSGGLVYNDKLVEEIRTRCGFLAPIYAYPGEFEMEALANGVLRVLRGEETPKDYDRQESVMRWKMESGYDPSYCTML